MEPVFAMFILFVLAPLAVFRGIRSLRESKYKAMAEGRMDLEADRASGETPMRQSELRAMIDEAVIEATIPLVERIEELEREMLLGDGRLDRAVLAEAFGEDEAPEAEGPESQRQRV